jgi:hypothetical protein
MELNMPLRALRLALTNLYHVRAIALRHLDAPVPPPIRQRWHLKLARLEQAICEGEEQVARVELRLSGLPPLTGDSPGPN